jgi:hypothetical protein
VQHIEQDADTKTNLAALVAAVVGDADSLLTAAAVLINVAAQMAQRIETKQRLILAHHMITTAAKLDDSPPLH